MFGETISTIIVMVLFGLLTGVILDVVQKRSKVPERTYHEKKNESTIDYMHRIGKEYREEVRVSFLNRPLLIGIVIFYALIALLIFVLLYSPVQMNWPIFLVSALGGFMITEIIFSLAKAGKIRVEKKTSWEISSSAYTLLNLGYSSWLSYNETKQSRQLTTAISFTEMAYSYASELDERESRNELLKCVIMNNLGYYLAEREREEDREFARECAEFIRNRIQKYPFKRAQWQDTYDYIILKYP